MFGRTIVVTVSGLGDASDQADTRECGTMVGQTPALPEDRISAPVRMPGMQLLLRGILAIVAAVVANLLVRAILVAVVDISPAFQPMYPRAIVFVTTLGVGAAVVVFALINRFTRRPVPIFHRVALVALVISLLPNVALLMAPSDPEDFPGKTTAGVLSLMLMHVVAYVITVASLTLKRD